MDPRPDRFRTTTLALAALAAGLLIGPLLLARGPAAAHTTVPPPTAEKRRLTVSGTARLEVPPDRRELRLELVVERPSPVAAARELRRKRRLLIRALKGAGIQDANLIQSFLQLQPTWKKQRIDGYRAQVSLIATLSPGAELGQIMQVATAGGVTRLYSRYRSSKLTALKAKVRRLAVQAAKRKARELARELGVKLGVVITASEGGSTGGHRPYGYWGWNRVDNAVYRMPAAQSGPARPDAIPLRLAVNVTYALR